MLRVMRLCSALALLWPLALAGCGGPATAVVLSVSADAQVVEKIDAIKIEVFSGGSAVFSNSYLLSDGVKLPGTLTLAAADDSADAPSGGSLPPGVVTAGDKSSQLRVSVQGVSKGTAAIVSLASFGYVSEETKKLSISLDASCLSIVCDAGHTCQQGRCVSASVDVASLPAGP